MLLGITCQIVASTEALSRSLDDDHVHLVVCVGPFDRRPYFSRHLVADGIESLWPVQQQAGDARILEVFFNLQGAESGHGWVLG
ncbi:hypothetical protein D3C71_2116630 [compost metagenome]